MSAAANVHPSGVGTYSVLYAFQGTPDAASPQGVRVDRAGNIFGISSSGGSNDSGSVFELTANGSTYAESIVHNFDYAVDGYDPVGAPFVDRKGVLYATAQYDGVDGCGSVVELRPTASGYAVSNRADFTCGVGGPIPGPPFKEGKTIYLTTSIGFAQPGTLTALNPPRLRQSTLYEFPQNNDINNEPNSGLTNDASGALYGTTLTELFKFVPTVSGGTETTLWTFARGGGSQPEGGVVLDKDDNIYGTTQSGGRNNLGIVYKISGNGSGGYSETILHEFANGSDGAQPAAGVVLRGNVLYGTTEYGGSGLCQGGCGTLFKVSTDGSHYAVVHTFLGNDGAFPTGNLAVSNGSVVGATSAGGLYGDGIEGYGVAFRYVP